MKRTILNGLLAGLVLAGCSGESPEKQLASAKDYLQKNDTKAAVIQIKNVLQAQPESGEARFLYGRTLLEQGDAAAAEVELRKALAASYPKDAVVPELADALARLGEAKKLVDEFGATQLGTPRAQARLKTALVGAYAALGKRSEAQAALDAALAADPAYAPAQLMLARSKAATRDVDGAIAVVDAVLQADPKDAEAWRLKGDLLQFGKADADGALDAYRKAVAAAPDSLAAQSSLVTALLRKGNLDEAAQQIEQVKKLAPKNPSTKFLEATLAFQKKDFKTARDLVQELVPLAPKDPRVLQLAGATELQLGAPAQAQIYLERAIEVAPNLPLARRLLVATYLRTAQPPKALALLKTMDPKTEFDAAMWALAGEVYLQNGDVKSAEAAFAQSLKLDPADARKRTALAVTHLASGRTEAGLDELQDIAGTDTGVTADMALISAHLRRKEFDKALAAVAGLEKKQPGKPLAANLRGRIQLMQNDTAGARKSFEQALAIDPNFFPAVASLASLDMADKQPAEAKKRFEALLAKDPKNVQAMLALAQLAGTDQATQDEALGWLKKAVDAAPASTSPRLLLIDAYLRRGDQKQALAAAQAAAQAIPESTELLIALGRVQQVSGDVNQAIATYGKAVAAQPLSPVPLVRLAEAQVVAKDFKAAEQSLRKALELKPDYLDAQRGLILVRLNDKNFDGALATAREVQQQRPQDAVGWLMAGDIEASRQGWPAAAAAYQQAFKLAPVAAVAVKVHAALQQAGNAKEAEQFAQTWQAKQPKDVVFPMYLAERDLAAKDYPAAEKRLQMVLKTQPDNAVALNNLAWAELQLKRNDDALRNAERANQLAPKQPPFMDTLAAIQSARGEHAKAIEMQTQALALQPGNAAYRLNLAKIYVAAGDKAKAKVELQELTKLGDKFAGQAEAGKMLKALDPG
ncbi:MAG: PEP-CTERM system TPR-repeat protein PrsT [Rubrivivax sp.]|nr:PEP-CTERM system TPR-repeat protein PrsT [Rubrivivax sp.]